MGLTRERWIELGLRPIGVAFLYGCVVQALIGVGRMLYPGWSGEYLVWLGGLAALEAQASFRILRFRSRLLDAVWKYRLGELILLYFVVQAGADISEGHPLSAVGTVHFDEGKVFAFLLVLFCWLGAGDTARDLHAIGEPAVHDQRYVYPADRLINRFFIGAGVLLAATGLREVGLRGLINLAHPAVSDLAVNVVLYVTVGTVLLGQIRYSALSARWQREGSRVPVAFGSRWARTSLVFLVLCALCALVLPTRYTLGTLDLFRYGVDVVLATAQLVIAVVLFPLGRLLSLLTSHGVAGHARQALPPLHTRPVHRAPPGAGFDPLAFIRSLLFWAVVLGVGALLARQYLAGHRHLGRALGSVGGFWLTLRLMVRSLLGRLKTYRQSVGTQVSRALRRRRAAGPPAQTPRLRFGTGSARDRVIMYYLATARRGEQHGVPRRPAETPGEYGRSLDAAVPAAREDVVLLTRLFVRARYAPVEVGPAAVGQARAAWRAVRAALIGRVRE